MEQLFGPLILLATIALMEPFAWLVHKYLLHGPLWWLHRSHHVPVTGFFERNDWVAAFYALLSVGLVVWGDLAGHWVFWVGLGIAGYGLLYFVMHDVLVHQRLRWRIRPASRYLRRIVRAHKLHHKHLNRNGSEAFGFLYAHPKYDPERGR